MASESSVTDQSIDEHADEKKIGDDNKFDGEVIIFQPKDAAVKGETDNNKDEGLRGTASTASVPEEKHEPDDFSVADETKKEERHEKVGVATYSLQESEVSNSSEPAVETYEGNIGSLAAGDHETPSEVQEKSTDFVQTSAFQEPVISESKTENESKPEELPLVSTGRDTSEDGNVESETQEAANPESSKDKVDIELIKSEDSMDEIQELAPAEFPTVVVTSAYEAPEKHVTDSSTSTSIEVPVKDLEVESGSPEEQKPGGSTETKEPSSNATTIDNGSEVVGCSTYEEKPLGIEKKDKDLEEKIIQTSVEVHEYLEAKTELPRTPSDEDNGSAGVEVKKDDEILEGGIETSTVLDDVPLHANVSSGEEKASEPGEVVEKNKDETFEVDRNDSALKVAKVLLEGGSVLEGDKLVDKEKYVNAEAVERDLIDTFIDPIESETSSDVVKAPETTEIVKEQSDNEVLGVKYKELNISPEASEVPSEGDKVSAGDDEKNESLKGEDATLVEAPKNITTVDKSLDQTIEKSESSKSEVETPTKDKLVGEEDVNVEAEERDLVDKSTDLFAEEVSFEQVKAPETAEILKEESDEEVLEVTSKELNIALEASEVPYWGDKVSTGDERSESLKREDATLVEAPEYITTTKESLDQVIEEKKNESSKCETKTPTEDKLVDKEKDVNVDVEKRDLVDTSMDPTTAEISSIPIKAPETAEPVKEESDKEALEVTSKELNIALEASEVPSGGDKVSTGDERSESLKHEDATSMEAPEYIITTKESLDQVIEETMNESSKCVTKTPTEDKLVGKEKDVNVKLEKRDLVDTSMDPTAAEISSKQVKAPETAEIVKEDNKESLEMTSKEVNIAPEASEVPSEGDKVSAGEEQKSESFKNEATASVEAPKDITLSEESLDQVIEEDKIEISKSEMDTQVEDKLVVKEKHVNVEDEVRDLIDTSTYPTATEVSYEQVKSPKTSEIVEESDKKALEVTSKELNIAPGASEVPSEGDKDSAGDEEKNESSKEEDATSVVVEEKGESSRSETDAPTEDKFVDKEKDVNVGDEDRYLVDTSTDPTASEVSSKQVKAPETAEIVKEENDKEALEVTSRDLNIAPEASEYCYKGDKVSAADEVKSESLKGEVASSVEAPKDFTTSEESLDQVIEEKKSDSLKSETEALIQVKFVETKKDVEVEAVERNLVDKSTDSTAAELSSEQVKALETIEIAKEREKEALEVTSKELNIAPEASEVPSERDKFSAGDEEKSESLKSEAATSMESDQVIEEKSESSKSEMEAQSKDKLVDNEKDENVDAEGELVNRSANSTAVEVSSKQVKAPEAAEIVKEESGKDVFEVTSKELNIAPEASEVLSVGDKVSASDENSESLKGEDKFSMEAPKYITTAEESLHPVIEEMKNESSKSETGAPVETTKDFYTSELSSEAVKDIIASETVEGKKEETSKGLSVGEKKANDPEDKEEEVKVEGASQNATDRPEQQDSGAEKEENAISKDQDPLVSSDTKDAKLIKEVTKRESNIFTKVKRSIAKAKKAILRKSPGPKPLSSEAKD